MLNCNHIQSVEMLMKHLWSWKLVFVMLCYIFILFYWNVAHLPNCPMFMLLIYLFSVNNLFGVFFLFIEFFLRSLGAHRYCSFAFSSWLNLLFNFHTILNTFRIHPNSHQWDRPANFSIAQQFPETMNVIAFSLLLSKFTVWSIIYGGFLNIRLFFFCTVATQILPWYSLRIHSNIYTKREQTQAHACIFIHIATQKKKERIKLIGFVRHVIFQWDNRARLFGWSVGSFLSLLLLLLLL